MISFTNVFWFVACGFRCIYCETYLFLIVIIGHHTYLSNTGINLVWEEYFLLIQLEVHDDESCWDCHQYMFVWDEHTVAECCLILIIFDFCWSVGHLFVGAIHKTVDSAWCILITLCSHDKDDWIWVGSWIFRNYSLLVIFLGKVNLLDKFHLLGIVEDGNLDFVILLWVQASPKYRTITELCNWWKTGKWKSWLAFDYMKSSLGWLERMFESESILKRHPTQKSF